MKRMIRAVLVLLLAFACTGMALAESSVSITTGLPTTEPARIMVVQMDNEPKARPQKGIASADVVYEIELYNGGYTRYTAVFNDNVPDEVEAVRSARIVNADMYMEYNGAFVHFGGQEMAGSSVYDYFKTLDVGARYDGLKGSNRFYRDKGRSAPNNVVCKLSTLLEDTDWSNITCKSPLKFNATAVTPEGEDVTAFKIPYRDGYTPSYVWDAAQGLYLRSYNGTPYCDGTTGEQVACANVIVQSMDYGWYEGQSDRPKVTTVGTNRCEYFIGGKHFSGYWQRDSIESNTVYYDDAGNEVLFNPGVTFVQTLKTEKSVEITE